MSGVLNCGGRSFGWRPPTMLCVAVALSLPAFGCGGGDSTTSVSTKGATTGVVPTVVGGGGRSTGRSSSETARHEQQPSNGSSQSSAVKRADKGKAMKVKPPQSSPKAGSADDNHVHSSSGQTGSNGGQPAEASHSAIQERREEEQPADTSPASSHGAGTH
jgi:hypothetical protein